jgi:hypothetical protein
MQNSLDQNAAALAAGFLDPLSVWRNNMSAGGDMQNLDPMEQARVLWALHQPQAPLLQRPLDQLPWPTQLNVSGLTTRVATVSVNARDLDPAKNTVIAVDFLTDNSDVTAFLNMNQLQDVTVVCGDGNHTDLRDGFLSGCLSLRSVRFICPYVEKVGDDFLSDCQALVSVDFAGLESLQSVGDRWLYNSGGPQPFDIDFGPLRALGKVGKDWMKRSAGIRPRLQGVQPVEGIGQGFMEAVQDIDSAARTFRNAFADRTRRQRSLVTLPMYDEEDDGKDDDDDDDTQPNGFTTPPPSARRRGD